MTSSPSIQWYPGHIAKAEKALTEQLKRVDVVLEVRDARIPLATCHPQIDQWLGSRGKVLVLNRQDMISTEVQQVWTDWFKAQTKQPYFTDAQHGKGVAEVAKAARSAGVAMNQRRRDRGLKPRPVRAVVIGFPNVGKSALINRLLKRRVAESARRPGVTRQLRWIRLSDQLELLDAPGVLPAHLKDQSAAIKLAICDDIGTAAYDNQRVAAQFVDLVRQLQQRSPYLMPQRIFETRYSLAADKMSGESYLAALAEVQHQGDAERTARRVLTDFRKGDLGTLALELPPCHLQTS
ncbi:MAG: ribosome biogenesis GTPase YlqF [Leptolyngbyaceae cyanobacterium SM1_1_3]|nr:ribosome biogenesis GTPase YlqF [Leptolyngbyaceae cyanobacterium SM1_1_3]NJN01930.1 ribosome biogenesis GTPase YlqF [Leptolyngbyaceae cyanobacterium RM1_1_2]NJO10240.1 ribosome biogenesis GTPase YlqF [Leptolyngbyaceae cyanobacterium SL_1_1]